MLGLKLIWQRSADEVFVRAMKERSSSGDFSVGLVLEVLFESCANGLI